MILVIANMARHDQKLRLCKTGKSQGAGRSRRNIDYPPARLAAEALTLAFIAAGGPISDDEVCADAAPVQGPTLLSKLFTGTRNFASGFSTTVLFLFFLLVSGDIFLHRLVEILPRFKSKRQVVILSMTAHGR
jgi:hypothetical protein